MNVRIQKYSEEYYMAATLIMVFINSFFYDFQGIALVVGIIETFILLYYFLKEKAGDFIIWMLILTSSSVSTGFISSNTNDIYYGFLNLPVIHYYHLFFLLFAVVYKLYSNGNQVIVFKDVFIYRLAAIYILELVITCFTYLINDNGIASLPALARFTIRDIYDNFWALSIFLIIWRCFQLYNEFENKIKNAMRGFFCGTTLATLFVVLLGKTYAVNTAQTNLVSTLAFFFAPILILIYYAEKKGYRYLLIGIIACVLQIKYTLGIPGAWWIFFAFVILVLLIWVIRNARRKKNAVIVFGAVMAAAVAIFYFSKTVYLQEDRRYIDYKLETFLNLFKVGNGFDEWMILIGHSIGIRVEAFINIIIEFLNKPYYLITGKGFGGSITKYWGYYSWGSYPGDFPYEMNKSGIYSFFHTQLLEFMINGGLIGFVLCVKCICITISEICKAKKYNYWIVVGCVWMLLLPYGFHNMYIGVGCLCYGLYIYSQ